MTTQISKLKEGNVKFQGMVETVRDKKNIQFVIIKDFSGKIQVTVDKTAYPQVGETFSKLLTGSTVIVEGKLVKSEYVKMGGQEVLAENVTVTSSALEAYPIGPESNIDQRIDYRWLDLRQEKNQLTFKIQTLFTNAMREFLLEKDFTEIHSPKLIATASESGSEVFEVKYFNGKAYLAQSPQFYKQMAICSGFGRVFECGPVFRAEKSHSKKHATEFTGFDLEFCIEKFEDVMQMEEELLTYAIKKVSEKYGSEIKEVFGVDLIVPKTPFPRIKLADLYNELEKRYGYKIEDSEKDDLSTEAEKLCKQFSLDAYGHEFVFVTDFGPRKRAFYHLRENGIPQGCDLIWKGMEVSTTAQREHRYDILKQQAEEKGLAKDVEFYLQFFKYGCQPHGGFGLGLDRLLLNMLELPNIKEAMYIFRGPERITP